MPRRRTGGGRKKRKVGMAPPRDMELQTRLLAAEPHMAADDVAIVEAQRALQAAAAAERAGSLRVVLEWGNTAEADGATPRFKMESFVRVARGGVLCGRRCGRQKSSVAVRVRRRKSSGGASRQGRATVNRSDQIAVRCVCWWSCGRLRR